LLKREIYEVCDSIDNRSETVIQLSFYGARIVRIPAYEDRWKPNHLPDVKHTWTVALIIEVLMLITLNTN
jgi:hypothetical protein